MTRPAIPDASQAGAPAGQVQIAALGASNTAGYGVGSEYAYPAALARLLRGLGHDVVMHNAGISGNTTAQMLARLETAVPSETQLVLFQPGSNDARLGISDAEREHNILTILRILSALGIPVIRVAAAFEVARRDGNFQDDGIHYTAAGHQCIANALLPDVVAALRQIGVERNPT